MVVSSLPNPAQSLLQFRFPQPLRISQDFPKVLPLITKMSSWTCSSCTFVNPPAQKSCCEICLSAPPRTLLSLSSAASPSPGSNWSCSACTFLNPYCSKICDMCGIRANATRLSALEIDDDDLDEAELGRSVGSVFLPLKNCAQAKPKTSGVGGGGTSFTGKISGSASFFTSGNFGEGESNYVDSGGSGDGVKMGFSAGLRPCSNKRKHSDVDDGGDAGGSSGFRAAKDSNMAVQAKSLGETHLRSETKMWKFLSYNVWFREDVEMHKRMRAIGNLIELHSPDVICFQEVTPSFYDIFQKSSWWKSYRCSIADESAFPGGYFCMQLSKLPVKSFSCRSFHNSIMGRELCVAEVEVAPGTTMVVATSHLESPCPSPPTWDQFYSKERVIQANEAVRFLEKNENVIFCGDMNWDDKTDGPFPLPDGWVDAWAEKRPGEDGWTYDTKSNKMLTGNRSLQKRLDRFVCKMKEFKISSVEMIGRDAIAGASFVKEKRVKGVVKELSLPVLPSDHYGLLLTICPTDST